MIKNMMNTIRGRKEVVVEKKNIFGKTTKVEISVVDRKGNVVESRVEKVKKEKPVKEKRVKTTEDKLKARGVKSTEEKLAERRKNKKDKKVNGKAVAAGIGAASIIGARAYTMHRYNKIAEAILNDETTSEDFEAVKEQFKKEFEEAKNGFTEDLKKEKEEFEKTVDDFINANKDELEEILNKLRDEE